MEWDRQQLVALAAAIDHGTFDAAAVALHLTPSAVSQRIRALENRVGQIVVTRGRPCRPTTAGSHLLRMARQIDLVEAETIALLGAAGSATDTGVAVNADSLNSWFHGVLGQVASWTGVTLRLYVEDQEHSAALLRSGEVLGAVTSVSEPVQGCAVQPLGAMRYLPVASPELVDRHRTGQRINWAGMPMLRFNDKDLLQHQVLQAVAPDVRPRVHQVPSSADFAVAVRLGLGWALLPESQIGAGLDDGTLVRIDGRRFVDVPLYWQRWRLGSAVLDQLTSAVTLAATGQLRRAGSRQTAE